MSSLLGESFTNSCDSIRKCHSLKRIKSILDYYQCIDTGNDNNNNDEIEKFLEEYIKNNKYKNIINDYHHILLIHLNNPESIKNYNIINTSVQKQLNVIYQIVNFSKEIVMIEK